MIHGRIMLMRLNDASKKSFETGHANLYIFPFFHFFFFYYLSAHLPKDENTGNSLTSSIFSCADLLNGFGQFQTIINSAQFIKLHRAKEKNKCNS